MVDITMREMIAQAQYKHDADQSSVRWLPWINATKAKRQLYLMRAHVALCAMRQLTSTMEAAMSDAEGDSLGSILTTPLSKVYVAAIDAAIAEPMP